MHPLGNWQHPCQRRALRDRVLKQSLANKVAVSEHVSGYVGRSCLESRAKMRPMLFVADRENRLELTR